MTTSPGHYESATVLIRRRGDPVEHCHAVTVPVRSDIAQVLRAAHRVIDFGDVKCLRAVLRGKILLNRMQIHEVIGIDSNAVLDIEPRPGTRMTGKKSIAATPGATPGAPVAPVPRVARVSMVDEEAAMMDRMFERFAEQPSPPNTNSRQQEEDIEMSMKATSDTASLMADAAFSDDFAPVHGGDTETKYLENGQEDDMVVRRGDLICTPHAKGIKCESCDGTGRDPNWSDDDCTDCDGKGRVAPAVTEEHDEEEEDEDEEEGGGGNDPDSSCGTSDSDTPFDGSVRLRGAVRMKRERERASAASRTGDVKVEYASKYGRVPDWARGGNKKQERALRSAVRARRNAKGDKDLNELPRPLTPFMIFSQQQRAQVRQELLRRGVRPRHLLGQTAVRIGELWRKLDEGDPDRVAIDIEAAVQKERYARLSNLMVGDHVIVREEEGLRRAYKGKRQGWTRRAREHLIPAMGRAGVVTAVQRDGVVRVHCGDAEYLMVRAALDIEATDADAAGGAVVSAYTGDEEANALAALAFPTGSEVYAEGLMTSLAARFNGAPGRVVSHHSGRVDVCFDDPALGTATLRPENLVLIRIADPAQYAVTDNVNIKAEFQSGAGGFTPASGASNAAALHTTGRKTGRKTGCKEPVEYAPKYVPTSSAPVKTVAEVEAAYRTGRVSKLKCRDLRAFFYKKGLPLSGGKRELVARLRRYAPMCGFNGGTQPLFDTAEDHYSMRRAEAQPRPDGYDDSLWDHDDDDDDSDYDDEDADLFPADGEKRYSDPMANLEHAIEQANSVPSYEERVAAAQAALYTTGGCSQRHQAVQQEYYEEEEEEEQEDEEENDDDEGNEARCTMIDDDEDEINVRAAYRRRRPLNETLDYEEF